MVKSLVELVAIIWIKLYKQDIYFYIHALSISWSLLAGPEQLNPKKRSNMAVELIIVYLTDIFGHLGL